ncbi:replication initiator protein [Dipodfec virus UOA04_Rod_462]|nr:replication initiator protein [Dipodfec virus UOA04_Rod_462]
MCLSPNYIVNPYLKTVNRYIDSWSTPFRTGKIDRTRYNLFMPPSATKNHVTEDTFNKYFVTLTDGECIDMYLKVPCGKCFECIETKQRQIRTRMLLEQVGHSCQPLFVTLTYRDDCYPGNGVSKEDLQLFFKRLRINLKRSGRDDFFRYIFFSEYGKKRGRAHYHGIIFGLPAVGPEFFRITDLISDSWSNGFVNVKTADSSKFDYVSKYACKDFLNKPQGHLNPNFWLASRGKTGGIGTYCMMNESFMINFITTQYPRLKIKVLGKVHEIFLPPIIRNIIAPTYSKLVSPNKIRTFKRLCADLRTLKLLQLDDDCPETLRCLDSDLDDDIRDKFFFLSDVSESIYHSPLQCEFDMLKGFGAPDPVALRTRITMDTNELLSYQYDFDRLLSSIMVHGRLKRLMSNVLDSYIASQPPAHQREILLKSKFFQKLCHMDLDGQ